MKHSVHFSLLVTCVVLCGCDLGLCGNDVVSEMKSPNGKLKVVVFERDCGATTNFTTQISILRAGQSLPSEGGNLFVADDNHHVVPVGNKGTMEVKVKWESNSLVSVSYPENARVFLKNSSAAGVAVKYEAAP